MLIKKAPDIATSEITPKWLYLNRRKFLTGALAVTAGAVAGRTLQELLLPSQKMSGRYQAELRPGEPVQHF